MKLSELIFLQASDENLPFSLSEWMILTGNKVKELEAQIEKMKCCGNCKHGDLTTDECQGGLCWNNGFINWELKE